VASQPGARGEWAEAGRGAGQPGARPGAWRRPAERSGPAGHGLERSGPASSRIARHDHAPQHLTAGAHPHRASPLRVRVALGGRALHKVAQRQPVSLDARRRPVVQVRRMAASDGGVRVFVALRAHVRVLGDTCLAASGASAAARAWLRRCGLGRLRRTAAKATDDSILLAELVGESRIDIVLVHRRWRRRRRCRRRARARVSHQPVEKVATLHLHTSGAVARLLRSRAPARMCARACA